MASKSKRRRRVLGASCILAALIVAGSSFAWFTSKDEVTNRLTANANYGVAIAEDFTPPANWLPGQQINKDAGVVNTGNIDAFVRMYMQGEMSILKRTTQANSIAMPSSTITPLNGTTDQRYVDAGFTYYDGSGNYYKELSKTKRDNPSNNATAAQDPNNDNTPAEFSEIQSIQAGGYLASVPSNAQYYYIVEQATTISAYETTSTSAKTTINLKAGDIVATKGATTPTLASGQTAAYIDAETAGINTDTSEFYPQTEGVYLFRRNIALNITANTEDDYEYSGYYYVPQNGQLISDATNDHYLALYTSEKTSDGSDRSDYTVPDNAVNATTVSPSNEVTTVAPTANMKFYNAAEVIVNNKALTWTYTSTPGNEKLTAQYDGGTTTEANDDISVDVSLANIGTTDQTWKTIQATAKSDTENTTNWKDASNYYTFYYNDDVEEGDTTTKLVDSVTLSSDTKKDAYVVFNFDLNLFMDSAQVTKNEAGQEKTTPVESGGEFANTTGDAAPAYATNQEVAEIANIGWNAGTTAP